MELIVALLKIAAVFLLVFLNGFFVAAEFAIVKVRSTQIETLVKGGQRRARVAQHVVKHLDAYLSATQLGITLTSLALGWAGEPFVGELIEPLLEAAGIAQPAIVKTVSFAVAFSIITFLHIVLGELAPKSLAIQRPQQTTLAVARPLHFFHQLFRPVIWALNGSANYFVRRAGIEPAGEAEMAHSEEELRMLLSRGTTMSQLGRAISLKAMDLRNRTVREVMVPRTNVVFLSLGRSIEENIATALENQFTRYPLCERDLDSVIGMVHLKDLFKLKGETGPGSKLVDIKREMLFFPETTPVEKVLNAFLTRRMLMALAVDEYGGTAGLVTLENVLEEIVGEIRDEFDVEQAPVQKVAEGEFLVDGAMPLHEFEEAFAVRSDTRDVVTVSGYFIHLFGRLPEKGASTPMGEWVGTVEGVEGRKIRSVRLKRVASGGGAGR